MLTKWLQSSLLVDGCVLHVDGQCMSLSEFVRTSLHIGLTGVVNCFKFADPPTLASVLTVYLTLLNR